MSPQERRDNNHPGIRLDPTTSPSEPQLMRLPAFVSEMKISTIPQEKINHSSPEIRASVGSCALQRNFIINYFYHNLMTFQTHIYICSYVFK